MAIYDLAIADFTLPLQAAAAICALLAALIGLIIWIEKTTAGETRPAAALLPIARNRAFERTGQFNRWLVETSSTSPRGPPGRHPY